MHILCAYIERKLQIDRSTYFSDNRQSVWKFVSLSLHLYLHLFHYFCLAVIRVMSRKSQTAIHNSSERESSSAGN